MAQTTLPNRTRTDMSMDEDAIPGDDTSEVTKLFNERLQAYKHACGYIEEYITQTEKMQHAQTKEYEKILKSVSNPLKEADHFSRESGGMAEMFDNIRSNTQGMSHQNSETAKALKGIVLPIFQRLHAEIKNKQKELDKGVGKGSKAVDKARAVTQKHIESLGQNTAMHDSAGRKPDALSDPYVLQKGVYFRLNKQVNEENSSRQDMLSVQSNFSQFETHLVETFQQGMGHLMQTMSQQFDQNKALYGNIVQNAQRMNPLFEWNGFVKRKNDVLIDPNTPPRTLNSVTFPNQNHKSTQPLIQGSLERKSGVMRKYETSLYAVTPSQYLHQFKSDDNIAKDPSPDLSLHLPDCTVGGLSGNLFNIKGKDVSGGKIGSATSTTHEYAFKAHTNADAEKWYHVITQAVGGQTSTPASSTVTSPTSPTDSMKSPTGSLTSPQSRNVSGSSPLKGQEAGVTSSPGGSEGGTSGLSGKPGQY